MNAIEIHGLTKRYEGFTLGPLDLTLPAGCVMGLVGENGAGKSTVIRLILGLTAKDGGSVTLLGRAGEDVTLTKEDVGVVLDEVGIPGCLTAKQVGRVMAGSYRNWDDGVFRDYLQKLALPEDKPFQDFSKGMKMKLALAVALSHQPKLLILDEATSGLDPVVRDEILDIFCDFTRDEERSILISSHIVSDLEKICDYIAFLHRGKLMLLEEKDRLCERYGILRGGADVLESVLPRAVVGKKTTPYGVEAVVERDKAPKGFELAPIDIEQLFIFMVKGED